MLEKEKDIRSKKCISLDDKKCISLEAKKYISLVAKNTWSTSFVMAYIRVSYY